MNTAASLAAVCALLAASSVAAHASSIDVPAIRAPIQAPSTQRDLAACYTSALERDPAAHGRMEVRFTVGHDGQASDVVIARSDLDAAAGVCVAEVFARLRFPAGLPEPARIVYPLVFQPTD